MVEIYVEHYRMASTSRLSAKSPRISARKGSLILLK